jgi:hypothetical protein
MSQSPGYHTVEDNEDETHDEECLHTIADQYDDDILLQPFKD